MMLPKGEKRHQSLPPDFLSNLPDNVIDLILMCLPCKDAVRTSILSKNWRYNWCRRTEFELNEWDEESPEVKFIEIINQLLTHHEGPITKFTLNVYSLESCPKIDDFIYFLSMNDIQHLVLHFPWVKPYKMPFSLFTCSKLRHLTLHDCFLHPPSFFKEFDRLISLELCKVTISSELLESLISGCPLLEQLVLKNTEILDTIEINAPMLRSFVFKGNISSICLKNVPCLAKVSLVCDAGSSMVTDYYFGFEVFFESCSALEHLHMETEFCEMHLNGPDAVATRLSFDINSVKRFYLPLIYLVESYQLSCAL